MQVLQQVSDRAGVIDQRAQVLPLALLAGAEPEDAIVEPGIDQIIVQLALVCR